MSMSVEQAHFMQSFVRMCADASRLGWHEANGGNLSYRLSDDDVDASISFFRQDEPWRPLEHPVPELSHEHVLISASGAFLGRMAQNAARLAGIIELDGSGENWRAAWGFSESARPSSELETHLSAYTAGISADDGADRVIYHAHAPHVIALSAVLKADTRTWTRALWKCMTEDIIVFPQGIGVVPWMVPGSEELAQRTCELMATHVACAWAHHGIMVRAAGFEEAFGVVETVEKSAGIYLEARAASGGAAPAYLVSDDQLRAICARYDISPNEELLDPR